MSQPPPPHRLQNPLVSLFRHGDALRSRSVSGIVLSGQIEVPAPPARLVADWHRETTLRGGLAPGDVEPLPLARARMRWPDYPQCVRAVAEWTRALGLQDLVASSDVALMACRGARYHHDGAQYGGAAFCNIFLSEDCGLDLHFSQTGHRIALARGTAVIFDTGQPHAVVPRGSSVFQVADFPADRDCTQVFLTWELPIVNADLAQTLGIAFDIDASTALRLDDEQLLLNGRPARVCAQSGQWQLA